MSDDNKISEYRRKAGVKKAYVHEKVYEQNIISRAKHASRYGVKKRPVIRQGDTPSGKSSVISVTEAQYHAYKLIAEFFKVSGKTKVAIKILREMGIRKATLGALEKCELIQISDKELSLWKRHFTSQEQLEKYRAKT